MTSLAMRKLHAYFFLENATTKKIGKNALKSKKKLFGPGTSREVPGQEVLGPGTRQDRT